MIPFHIVEAGLQEIIIINILQLDPPTLTLDLSEYLVLMLAEGPVENASFRRASNAAGGYLMNVEVGVFFGGVVDVLCYGESYCGVGDGFAEEPGNALLDGVLEVELIMVKEVKEGYHLEYTIVVIGKRFVLRACQHWRSNWAWRNKPSSILR